MFQLPQLLSARSDVGSEPPDPGHQMPLSSNTNARHSTVELNNYERSKPSITANDKLPLPCSPTMPVPT